MQVIANFLLAWRLNRLAFILKKNGMEEFKKLQALLEIEREEDLQQYKKKMVLTPLKERQKKGLTWYPIKINNSEIGSGENFYITVERKARQDESHAFQVGDSVALANYGGESRKNQSLSGVVSSLWRNTMRISFNVDELPEWLDYGSLGVDLLFDSASYQEMKNALNLVKEAKNDRLAELRQVLLGKKMAEKLAPEDIPEYYKIESLNDSQNLAIRNILAAKDIAIVHGPPGTGKTTTLVDAVKLTLQNERQVLVAAPSNTAVDVLTERLAAKGLKVLRIGNPARVSEELMQYSLEAQVAQHSDYRILKKLRRDAEEYKKLARKYKRNFGKEEREQRRLLYAEANRMLFEATTLEKYIVDTLLSQTQVVAATLVGSVNKFIRYRRFTTVFIDEAAQALEPATWIPITKAERVVFAGDHFQLPPTVKSFEAAQAGLAETLFEKVIQKQEVDVMLKVQYRMNETIMNFSSQEFYDNGLEADRSVKKHLLSSDPMDPILGPPLEFIDTAGCSFDEAMNEETKSRFNPQEAILLTQHLQQMLEYMEQTHAHLLEGTLSIGIISPYNAQVAHLRERIKSHPDLEKFRPYMHVNSIDGFQGQERDVIYISLVRSNAKGQIGFLADTRRLNVALTRARKKLVVIGDSATLGQHNFYKNFLDYAESQGVYKSAWEYKTL